MTSARRIDGHGLCADIVANPARQLARAARLQPVEIDAFGQGHGMKSLARTSHIDSHDPSLCSTQHHARDPNATK